MLKYFKIFIMSNITILAILLFLPTLLITTDITPIETLIDYLTN